jgi:HlyD family secretion protein
MRLTVFRHALLLAATLSGVGFSPVLADTAVTTQQAAAAEIVLPAISVTAVTPRKLEDHVLASGLITPVEQVSVVPLIEGQPIESLAADVGDMVTAGQVLATLSTATLTITQSQLQAALASAQSSAAEAAKTADRTKALFAQGSTSSAANDQAQSSLIAARAQVTSMQAQLDTLTLQLSRTQVIAPVAGLITARNAQIGSIASAQGTPLFTLNRDNALELRADVAEGDMPKVAAGQTATITLAAAIPPLTGTIRLVEPDVDVTTRLGRARIAVTNPELVRSGMYAEANILVASRDGLALPVTALGSKGTESTVMLVKDGVVHRVTVTTGIRDGGWIEILTGLAAGDTVVAKAGAFVNDGDKINPVPAATN